MAFRHGYESLAQLYIVRNFLESIFFLDFIAQLAKAQLEFCGN